MKIRKAKKKDSKKILDLIKELARFEKLDPPTNEACKRLIKNAFSKRPFYSVIVAEDGKEIVAYAFYFFTYSSFLARRTLYLEDIFVTEEKRRSGVGKLMFDKLIKIAKKQKCGRMEWCVLDWNQKAIDFYNKLGANPLGNWIYYRMVFNNQ